MYLPRLRRLTDIVKEMKAADKDTAITYYVLQELIKNKKITKMKYGNAWVVNLDELNRYFKTVPPKRGRPKKEDTK